jgi:hypothetical protein
MGLVVELQPAPLELAGSAQAGGSGTAAAGDLFGALLAAIAGDAAAGDPPVEPSLPLPPQRRSPGADPLAALTLALVPAPVLPAQALPVAGPAAGPGGTDASPVPAPSPALPAEPALDSAPPADAAAGAAPGLAAAGESELPADSAAPESAGLASAAPTADLAAGPVAPAVEASAAAGADPPAAEPAAPRPAAEPPADLTAESSEGVVRTVGNAAPASETALPPGIAVREDRRPADRPLPRAAEPAIAHAAAGSAVGQLRETSSGQGAAPPAPAEPPPPAPPAITNLEAVATAVIERVEDGGGEARIRLEPAGLGEITIRLHARHEAVHLDIHAETPEAVALLRDAAADLSSLLGQRGMTLNGLSVGLGARQGGSGGWEEARPRQQPPARGEFAALLGIEDPAAAARHHRLRAAYNPDGSLLYRV